MGTEVAVKVVDLQEELDATRPTLAGGINAPTFMKILTKILESLYKDGWRYAFTVPIPERESKSYGYLVFEKKVNVHQE